MDSRLGLRGSDQDGGCACCDQTGRYYGRIGLFALNDGRLADGTPVLPSGWMADATAPSKGNGEYGYLWWLQDAFYDAVSDVLRQQVPQFSAGSGL
ncbi:hypothetical protein [Pararhizobium sp. IMCC21322]|uniref:hypothetical protein n=1 Tax=Pararhizobium sp. IMCC21322 TaxID=3067903 RepID=UPI002741548B|nr:hypothetical protein [Pararhizobium sp. IMCC21322]